MKYGKAHILSCKWRDGKTGFEKLLVMNNGADCWTSGENGNNCIISAIIILTNVG